LLYNNNNTWSALLFVRKGRIKEFITYEVAAISCNSGVHTVACNMFITRSCAREKETQRVSTQHHNYSSFGALHHAASNDEENIMFVTAELLVNDTCGSFRTRNSPRNYENHRNISQYRTSCLHESAVLVDWTIVSEIERRVSGGIDYEHHMRQYEYHPWNGVYQSCEQAIEENGGRLAEPIPVRRGFLAGLRVFSEEKERLKSAHAEEDRSAPDNPCI